MTTVNQPIEMNSTGPRASAGTSLVVRLLGYVACLGAAVGLWVAYEHFKLHGQTTQSMVSLAGAAFLALVPLRALLHGVFAIERSLVHLVHGVGGLVLIGLPLSGLVSGAPMLTHAAMAPFEIMGAAQAVMHQDHPRNAKQAEAMRGFAASLPEVAQFASAKDFTSAANVSRAVKVLGDLLSKAQALGETELNADPGFQAALGNATSRLGLGLGLDAIDHSLALMAKNPNAARAVPALRDRLAKVRRTIAAHRS